MSTSVGAADPCSADSRWSRIARRVGIHGAAGVIARLVLRVWGLFRKPVIPENYTELASGADKRVFVKTDDGTHVYKTPQKLLFGLISKERAMRAELRTIKAMRKKLPNPEHVDLSDKALKEKQWIPGRFTVKGDRAELGCYEQYIRDGSVDFEQRLEQIGHFLAGVAEIHDAGYVHGDLKPENALVFGEKAKPKVKITDFGRTRKMKADEQRCYLGNLVFVSPEGRMSAKGDVYASMISVIRSLEEALEDFDGTPLVESDKRDYKVRDPNERRGLERFIIQDSRFVGVETRNVLQIVVRRLPRQIKMTRRSHKAKAAQEKVINEYAGKVIKKLSEQFSQHAEKLQEMESLLKKMASTDPAKRPTAQKAAETFQEIIQPIGPTPGPDRVSATR